MELNQNTIFGRAQMGFCRIFILYEYFRNCVLEEKKREPAGVLIIMSSEDICALSACADVPERPKESEVKTEEHRLKRSRAA